MVQRAMPLKGVEFRNSILAEHGFSAFVRTTREEVSQAMLFDFGLSKDVAARNADVLNLDLGEVEAASLSHGHIDHFEGLEEIAERIGKGGLEFVSHPSVFKQGRFVDTPQGIKIIMPVLERSRVEAAGFEVTESKEPYFMLGGDVLFLGEIPRESGFEQGLPNAYYEKDGKKIHDTIEDDSALVMNLAGKGLVVLSGCAHSGIINTVEYAKKITGINNVHVVMGGFHLGGPAFEPIIDVTVERMKEIAPDYVIPTHCTGRQAIQSFERELSDAFIMNMAGTTLTFTGN
jgi:7,8-dihydropterin-6-yl-methyl-4-(beta-D-ribofuranosyl)aminobenzene 5'-phosphate synthase